MDDLENRREAKLRQLASRHEQRILKSINQSQTKKNIDLRATEKAFLDTNPTSLNMKTPINSNFTISTESTSSPILSFDEKADKQMVALATWTNTMIGLDSSEELDLGATAAEACRRIQKMLSKKSESSPTDVESLQATAARLRYQRIFEKNDSEKIKQHCRKLLKDSGIEQSIRDMLSKNCIAIKKEHAVYSDLSLQTTLLRTFLSFHPAWLKAALEAIFNAKIDAQPKFMIRALSQFFIESVFSNPAILKNKKFAQGSGVPIVTPAGKEALHRHFLEVAMKILFIIETAYNHRVIPNLTRIFTKSSPFKSLNDIFTELTRELLTGSSADFKKAFSRIGFQPTYKQSFIENYNYQAKGFNDFSDGLILAKLIETVGEIPHGDLLLKLRDPAGDRIRKVNNVEKVLQKMSAIGISTEDVTAADIVRGKKEAVLAILWSIVGVRVAKEKRVRYSKAPSVIDELTTPKKKRRSAVHDDMSSEVLKSLKVIGRELNQEVLDLDSIVDGVLLEKIWTTYVPNGTPIQLYSGDNLWEKIVSLAETELAIPRGLDQNVALFVKMFLERTRMVNDYNEKAMKIQRMWKAYLERKNTPKLYHVVQQVMHEYHTSRSLSPLSMSHLTENATYTVQNGTTPRESIQNNSTFNDATFTVSRDSIDSLSNNVFKMPRTPLRGTFTRTTIAKHLNEVIEEEEEEHSEGVALTEETTVHEEEEQTEKIDEVPEEAKPIVTEPVDLKEGEPSENQSDLPEENDETMVPSTLKKRYRVGHVKKTVFQEDSESGITTVQETSIFAYSEEVVKDSCNLEKENVEYLSSETQEESRKREDSGILKKDNEFHLEQEPDNMEELNSEDVQALNDVEMMDVSDELLDKPGKDTSEEFDDKEEEREDVPNTEQHDSEDTSEEIVVQTIPEVLLATPVPAPRTTIASPLPASMESTQSHSSESTSSVEYQLSEDQKKENDWLNSFRDKQKRFVEENNLEITIKDPKNVSITPELRRILRETREVKRKQEEILQARMLGAIEKRALAARAVNATEHDDDRSDAGHDEAILMENSEYAEEQQEKIDCSVDSMKISMEIERKNEEAARVLAETQEKQRVQAEKEQQAATVIQKVVRGFLARRRFRLDILNWRQRMVEYNQILAIENQQFERDETKDSSVEIKLRNCTLYGLTNDNLHIVHIAATIIDRITDLVPKLLEKFVVELNGIKPIYDILAVADQGFAYTAILNPLLHTLQKCFYVVPEEVTNATIHPLLPKLSPRLMLLMLKHSNNHDFFIPIITTLISIGRRFPHQNDSHFQKWENPIKQTMRKVTDQEGTNYLITLRTICDHL